MLWWLKVWPDPASGPWSYQNIELYFNALFFWQIRQNVVS